MILKNAIVVSPENNIKEKLDVRIENGIVSEIAKNIDGLESIDLTGNILVPAFVEMHCHLREPGYEEKETIETGVESAIAGGYGTICPMANTNPVNDRPVILRYIKNKSKKIHIAPICAVTKNLTSEDFTDFATLKAYGACAFSNDGKPIEKMNVLKAALNKAKDKDVLIISHAEDSTFSPYENASEYNAVKREIDAVKETDGWLHFAHISTKESLSMIKEAKDEGWNITCETAPHYFSLTKNDIENEEARFKMNPPLRSTEDKNAVIEALKNGTIDVIATDHAPHTTDEKTMEFTKAPMGIVGFETAFALGYTNLVLQGHLTLSDLIKKMSVHPSKILNFKDYGTIEVGKPANIAVIDPKIKWTVRAERFKTKCKISPFEGMLLTGKVIKTIIKDTIYDN